MRDWGSIALFAHHCCGVAKGSALNNHNLQEAAAATADAWRPFLGPGCFFQARLCSRGLLQMWTVAFGVMCSELRMAIYSYVNQCL